MSRASSWTNAKPLFFADSGVPKSSTLGWRGEWEPLGDLPSELVQATVSHDVVTRSWVVDLRYSVFGAVIRLRIAVGELTVVQSIFLILHTRT